MRLLVSVLLAAASASAANGVAGLRPPAVPLVAHDPYFSVWSAADRLTDTNTTHWTGHAQPLHGLVRIDGRAFRVLGPEPADCPALPQAGLSVLPTRTIATFSNETIRLTLTFLTPALPDDLDALSRPVTYVAWEAASVDGKAHVVGLYLDAGAELAVNTPDQAVVWDRPAAPGLTILRMASKAQPVLMKRGDNLRIDWGSAYLAAAAAPDLRAAIGDGVSLRAAFVSDGNLPPADDAQQPRAVTNRQPTMALAVSGETGARPLARVMMLAYDDEYALRYFQARLRPYWRHRHGGPAELLAAASRDYAALAARCRAFDERLMADLEAAGGKEYAWLCALAYRQTWAGNKIAADARGRPLVFPKENFSNGCIGTVDVLFPQAPFFLLFSPALTRAMLRPVLDYAASPAWPYDYAPHDLGTYPHATGQVYGMGPGRSDGDRMPVEECGNMLIMLAALVKIEGNADFVREYEPLLRKWADYLVARGLDPENQLCSADMFGHLPHAVNLALKAIIALGAYGQICDAAGRKDEARRFDAVARDYAAQWLKKSADEGRTRLAYHLPGTWGMKHNLIWDRILGLGLIPEAVGDAEVAWYLKMQKPYGLPVDNRTETSLLDWAMWSIAPARERRDFEALCAPLYRYANETPSRVPLSDWFDTTTGRQRAFQARPVVGGIFIRLLADADAWARWAGRAEKVSGGWAPFPAPVALREVAPTARGGPVRWRYTLEAPAADWVRTDFDDAAWREGVAGFGTKGTPGGVVRTEWRTQDIWLRRTFDLPPGPLREPRLLVCYDESPEIYVNGVLAAKLEGYVGAYEEVELSPAARAALKPGRNVFAVRASQTWGGQYIDVGLAEESPPVTPP